MIYPIFSYRDNKTCFGTPFVDQNEKSAIRGFSYAMNNGNGSIMGFSPNDFDLYKIGMFDSEKGTVTPIVPIELIASGGSVFNEK